MEKWTESISNANKNTVDNPITAEEFYHSHSEIFNYDKLIEAIKSYGRKCAEQALKDASENAYCSMEHPDDDNDLEESDYIVNKDSILDTKIITP